MATDAIARIITSFAGRIGMATNYQFKGTMMQHLCPLEPLAPA